MSPMGSRSPCRTIKQTNARLIVDAAPHTLHIPGSSCFSPTTHVAVSFVVRVISSRFYRYPNRRRQDVISMSSGCCVRPEMVGTGPISTMCPSKARLRTKQEVPTR